MAANPSVGELKAQAANERERVSRDLAEVRHGLRREMVIRGRIEEQIRRKPGVGYGAAAGVAAFIGYFPARYLKA